MTTQVEEVTTIQMVGVTNKKEIRRIGDNPETKAITEVVMQVDEEVVEGHLIRVIFSASIVRNMVIMLVIILTTKEIIKKVMQDL